MLCKVTKTFNGKQTVYYVKTKRLKQAYELIKQSTVCQVVAKRLKLGVQSVIAPSEYKLVPFNTVVRSVAQ